MKILKPGKVEQRKLTCPMCECAFVCGEYEYTFWDEDSLLVTCPCCHDDMPFYCGEPYEEPTQEDSRQKLIFLIKNFRATNLETADCEADFLIANGVTFREVQADE